MLNPLFIDPKQYILTSADPNSSVFVIYRQMQDTKVGHVGYFRVVC